MHLSCNINISFVECVDIQCKVGWSWKFLDVQFKSSWGWSKMETARIRNPLNSLDMALDKLCDPSSRRVKRKYLLGDNFFAHLLYKLSYMHIVVCNLRSTTRNRNHSREKFLISMLYPNIFNRQISKQTGFGAMEWNSWF